MTNEHYLSTQLIDSIINLLTRKGIGMCGLLGGCKRMADAIYLNQEETYSG